MKQKAIPFVFLLFSLLFSVPVFADWSSPVTISSVGSLFSKVGIDAFGNAVAVWEEFDGSNSVIQSAILPFGGTWSSPQTISVSGEDAINVELAVDRNGHAVAVWERFDGFNTIIQAATLTFGEVWSTPVNLSAAEQDASQARVAMDANGNAIAVWTRSNGFNDIIQGSTLSFLGSWTPPVNISEVGRSALDPNVAMAPNGDAVVVWSGFFGSSALIYASKHPFGGNWSSPVSLTLPGENALGADIAMDFNGNAVVTWRRSDELNFVIQAATLPAGGYWSSSVTLSEPGENVCVPNVAVSPNGNAVVVWSRFNEFNRIVQSSSLLFGASHWSLPLNVSFSDQDANCPQVAMDGNSNAFAIWPSDTGNNFMIQTSKLPLGGVWTIPINISGLDFDSDSPDIAITPSGYAVANWTAVSTTPIGSLPTSSSEGLIQASTMISPLPPPPLPPLPPSKFEGIVFKNKFLNKTEYFLESTWDESPSLNIAFYKIYKGNKLVKVVSSSAPRVFIVELSSKKAAKEYQISAVSPGGLESSKLKIKLGV